jgi:histidinol-phosphate phosphatase family protein
VVAHDGPGAPPDVPAGVETLRAHRRGPAAARNAGWRRCSAEWIAFLDDDVVPPPGWTARLVADLEGLEADVAGSQGRIAVPVGERPTDWERTVQGLDRARWATADMAYRRHVLAQLGGFDERFPRAYREDADLALRARRAGYRLVRGQRLTVHPPGAAGPLVSVRRQAGNADDALMRRLHGPGWRDEAGAPRGRLPRHAAVVAAGAVGLVAGATGRRRVAVAAGALWAAGTLELALARILPGPRTLPEIATMAVTSLLIPPAAVWHRLRGEARARRLAPGRRVAVLLDRDGTLVHDVPYNGDPALVDPVPGARAALDRLRAAGVPLAVVSNQSGIARGRLTREQVAAVNRRAEELLGPLGPWLVCPHGPDEGCGCRKPAPGLVHRAAAALGVEPADCVVVGDIGADVEAARAAGARAVLVPNGRTRPEEIAAADVVAPTLGDAVDLILAGEAGGRA